MTLFKIRPFFFTIEEDTEDVKISNSGVNKSSAAVFNKVNDLKDHFEVTPKENSVTLEEFIKDFHKIAIELIRRSDTLSTIVELNTTIDECFVTYSKLTEIADYLAKISTSNPLPFFAIFVCPIALISYDKPRRLLNKSFLGSKEKVFLFVYESNGTLNEFERNIISFQEEIKYVEKYRKYALSTYDRAVYDWVDDLEKYPTDAFQAHRLIEINIDQI
jgi:hypothetical protein